MTDARPPERQDVAVYVHVPFCRRRCTYCDFNTYAGLDHLIPAYVAALCREIASAPPARCRTIYLGGGTPSLLNADHVAEILAAVRARLGIAEGTEATIEANPGTVDVVALERLRALGMSRISLGIQSAHDDELALLGRIHTWVEAKAAVAAVRRAGFSNLNLDFIYGLPGQDTSRWQATLQAALALAPEHLSLYALTVEEGTALARRIAQGELCVPDEETVVAMIQEAEGTLDAAGYRHYEISNWARRAGDGSGTFACRHNLTYWRNEPYLGFGAGASSWYGQQRWTNVGHPAEYVARVEGLQAVAVETETIDLPMEMGETMMMGLRLDEGVGDTRFRARFGRGLEETYGKELAGARDLGLLEWDGVVACLTPRGRLLGNQVFGQFLPG